MEMRYLDYKTLEVEFEGRTLVVDLTEGDNNNKYLSYINDFFDKEKFEELLRSL